jgi:mRNA interferase MazF
MTTTPSASAHPEPGDIFWADLDPVRGSEQAGRRPVVVISNNALHLVSSRVLICPITSSPQPWPTKVAIPAGLPIQGFILTDQARMIDREARLLRHVCRLPDEVIARIRHRIAAFIGIHPPAPESP